jgi:hypothetical protein
LRVGQLNGHADCGLRSRHSAGLGDAYSSTDKGPDPRPSWPRRAVLRRDRSGKLRHRPVARRAVPRQGRLDYDPPRSHGTRLGDHSSGRSRRFLLYQYRAADAWPLLGLKEGIEKFNELATERRIGVSRRTTQNAISSTGCATTPMIGLDADVTSSDYARSFRRLRNCWSAFVAFPARLNAIAGTPPLLPLRGSSRQHFRPDRSAFGLSAWSAGCHQDSRRKWPGEYNSGGISSGETCESWTAAT